MDDSQGGGGQQPEGSEPIPGCRAHPVQHIIIGEADERNRLNCCGLLNWRPRCAPLSLKRQKRETTSTYGGVGLDSVADCRGLMQLQSQLGEDWLVRGFRDDTVRRCRQSNPTKPESQIITEIPAVAALTGDGCCSSATPDDPACSSCW